LVCLFSVLRLRDDIHLSHTGLLIDLFEHTALRPLYLNEAVSLGLTIGLKSPDEGVRGLALELLGSIAQASAEGAVHLVLANCVGMLTTVHSMLNRHLLTFN
jgi:hypothetical protein